MKTIVYIQVQGEIAEFLKDEENLPAGSSFHVMMIGTSSIDPYLRRWASFREEEMFQHLAQNRANFLRAQAYERGAPKDVFLLISVTIPESEPSLSLIEAMELRRDLLKATLRSIGLKTSEVDGEDLLRILRTFLGWSAELQPPLNPYETLAEQILPPHFQMRVEADLLLVQNSDDPPPPRGEPNNQGGHAWIALEAIKRPGQWTIAHMDLFLGNALKRGEYIPSDFIQSFYVHILPRQALEVSNALAKRESLFKNLNSGLMKWMPDIKQEYNDMREAVAAIQMGERVVAIHQNVILKDKPHRIRERAHTYCSMMRRGGFYFTPCTSDHLPVLLASLPMQGVEEVCGLFRRSIGGLGVDLRRLGRGIKTTSGEVKALLPIVGEWKGDLDSPGLILSGRRGQVMYWSPFGPALIPQEDKAPLSQENFNLCIAGVPGSGKSVFMQELMLSTLGVGGRVFVLDYGRSFKRSCQLLKGNYIEFDIKRPISLNPFSEVPEADEDFEAREDALSGIAAVLSSMAAPMEGTSDLQNALLQKALRGVWKEKKVRAEITDIAEWLLQREEGYARDLGNMLFPFTSEGIFGKFFSGPAGISLNHKMVVIETDHLRNVPALLTVVVQMMIVHINQTMVKGERKYPFLIMIDEAWKLLQGKASGPFIEEIGRIARKYKGSITLATQQLTDYFRSESPAAEKAFENASWKAILKQNPETLMAMRSNPKLASFVKEDWQLEFMQSIHSSPPNYSEVALFGPDVSGVIGRLMLDPFTLLLTSTNAEDYQGLEDKIHKGMSVTQAIEETLRKRGVL